MLERRSSEERGTERLAIRRRQGRRRALIVLSVLLLVLIGAFIWLTWQPSVRVSTITAQDENLSALAKSAIAGTYLGIIPRDSIFFVSESTIRNKILAAHPEIAAVSIKRAGLESLSISAILRVPVALWCGLQKTEGVQEYCYFFDTSGFVYAAAENASTTPTLNPFVLYAPLAGTTEEPLRATIANARTLSSAFDLARKLGGLGSIVGTITFRDDEVDDLLASGTRVTYLLGEEESAFTNLMSSKSNLNLADGSLEYVDLRFPAKVYLKKKGE